MTKRPRVQLAESLRGKLTSLEKVVSLGRLHFRAFQWAVTIELRRGRHPAATLTLPKRAKDDLRWWSQRAFTLQGQLFLPPPPSV